MRLSLLFLTCLFYLGINAQDNVHHASLSTGKANKLATYFDESIDLSIPNSKGIYSKQQAKLILSDFFESQQPTQYKVRHKGGSAERSFFEIGNLNCKNNSYRTYILYHKIENSLQIIELRIESED